MISVCFTTYNRTTLLYEAVQPFLNDPKVKDIVIVDDCSSTDVLEEIKVKYLTDKNVNLIQQLVNRGMSRNKHDAISYANERFAAILDSDNVFNHQYLDALGDDEMYDDIIYCPSFAMPHFDYRKYSGLYFDRSNVKNFIQDPNFNVLMNTCNYVVPKLPYLKAWENNKDVKGADTIWFNYNWLKNGGKFYVVPGMEYMHRVHPGSGFMKDAGENMKMADKIKKMILDL